jgi:SAM-dependent methyltransferase
MSDMEAMRTKQNSVVLVEAPSDKLQSTAFMNPNKALWEKGDFTRIADTMRESGEALVQRLGITKGLKVLDLGCGDGTTALPAAKLGADVLGVDIAQNLVAAGNKRAGEHGLTNCTFQDRCKFFLTQPSSHRVSIAKYEGLCFERSNHANGAPATDYGDDSTPYLASCGEAIGLWPLDDRGVASTRLQNQCGNNLPAASRSAASRLSHGKVRTCGRAEPADVSCNRQGAARA